MKRLTLITSALALMLTASATFAVEETHWGTLKQTLTQTPDGQTTMHFVNGAQAAAKKGKKGNNGTSTSSTFADQERTVSSLIGPTGGNLQVNEKEDSGPHDDLWVHFTVPEGALDHYENITMTVTGSTLSNLVVAFQPAGLEFLTNAKLLIHLGYDRADLDVEKVTVLHQYNSGEVEEAQIISAGKTGKANARISVWVPGFSRYSSGDGW